MGLYLSLYVISRTSSLDAGYILYIHAYAWLDQMRALDSKRPATLLLTGRTPACLLVCLGLVNQKEHTPIHVFLFKGRTCRLMGDAKVWDLLLVKITMWKLVTS